jgi:hypothetical protein
MAKELVIGQVAQIFNVWITIKKRLHGCMVVDKHNDFKKRWLLH